MFHHSARIFLNRGIVTLAPIVSSLLSHCLIPEQLVLEIANKYKVFPNIASGPFQQINDPKLISR